MSTLVKVLAGIVIGMMVSSYLTGAPELRRKEAIDKARKILREPTPAGPMTAANWLSKAESALLEMQVAASNETATIDQLIARIEAVRELTKES